MEKQLTLFAEDFLASHLVLPGSDEAMKMTASSGRKCAELLKRSDPVGLLVRMLLESSQWHSMMCYLTWKDSATPRGRLLFRLVPKMADTDEIGYSFWRTPQAHNGAQGPKSKEFFEHCLATGQSAITLTDQVRHAPVRLWMTPKASDGIMGQTARTSGRPIEKSTHLQTQVHVAESMRMWPTPQARDYRSADTAASPRGQRKTEQGWSTDLNDAVKLWPTPTVNGDHNRKGLSANSGDGLSTAVKMWGTPTAVSYKGASQHGTPSWERDIERDNLKAQVMKPENKGQLNPDWEETLMNFPVGWSDPDVPNEDLYMLPNPAPFGMDQYDFEPPRVTSVKKNRAARVKAIGNAVDPAQIAPIFAAISEIERGR